MHIDKKYSRRELLNRMGGAAAISALSPFIPYTEAEAQAEKRVRYCPWFTPIAFKSGIVKGSLPTANGAVGDLVWRGSYSAMNDMKGKISFYRGMMHVSNRDGDLPGGHSDPYTSALVGVPVKKGQAGSGTVLGDGNAGLNGASSIDQFIAEELKKKGYQGLRDIRYGYETSLKYYKTFSYLNGKAMLRDEDPRAVFKQIFPYAGGASGAGGPDLSYRKKILDFVNADLKRVRGRLSQLDRQRLESHATAIEEAQELVRLATSDAPMNNGCALPEGLNAETANLEAAISAFTKLTAIAFNCDITRIAGGQWGPYQGGNSHKTVQAFNVGQLHPGGTFHSATHKGSGAFGNAVLKFRAKIFVDLLKELDQFEEPTGETLLDNSIVHWYSECPYDHSANDMPHIIGGSGGGYFKAGKQCVVGNIGKEDRKYPQNMLLVSIANAMGIKIDQFGRYNAGPIPNQFVNT